MKYWETGDIDFYIKSNKDLKNYFMSKIKQTSNKNPGKILSNIWIGTIIYLSLDK